jgi:5-methylcytosine-specific restriction endonuclease McrA
VDDKPALALSFDKFAPGQRFHGLQKVYLNNSVQDPSYLSEKICREMFLAAGLPAPRAGHAVVHLNRRNLGLYVLLEGWDKRFLKQHFNDARGNLYDGGYGNEVTNRLDINSGDFPNDRSRLELLAQASEEPDLGKRLARMGEALDMDRFLTFVAMEIMLAHWDGYTMNRNNFRIFHDLSSNRLVFLLDHEYTQRGLNWHRLKGADAERARRVRPAADRAGCEAVLALAEVKETWDALPADHARRDCYDDYYEVEDEDEDPTHFELSSLIDDEITLGWWTNPDGTDGESITLHIRDDEVCATTPTVDLVPYQSAYEGYMGNYGNTLDRWYRRAAVVVWPRDRAFAARAEAGSRWALDKLRHRIEVGDVDGARAAAESLAPFWKRVGSQAELLVAALEVAAGLDAARTAAMLLEPFRIEIKFDHHKPIEPGFPRAALHRNAVNPRPRKPAAHHWAKTPETQAVYGSAEYRRARDRLVAAAVGTPCPGCGRLLTTANCQADHVIARAQGATSSSNNLRPLCASCNHKRGSSLGGG